MQGAESSSFDTTMDAAMSHGFFCLTPYAGTIVDAADITAVGNFTDWLASAGYLPRAEVNRLLKTDSVFAGAFWQKTAARLGL